MDGNKLSQIMWLLLIIGQVPSQWAKLPEKQSAAGVYFENMALYFECRINKNALFLLWIVYFGF